MSIDITVANKRIRDYTDGMDIDIFNLVPDNRLSQWIGQIWYQDNMIGHVMVDYYTGAVKSDSTSVNLLNRRIKEINQNVKG